MAERDPLRLVETMLRLFFSLPLLLPLFSSVFKERDINDFLRFLSYMIVNNIPCNNFFILLLLLLLFAFYNIVPAMRYTVWMNIEKNDFINLILGLCLDVFRFHYIFYSQIFYF